MTSGCRESEEDTVHYAKRNDPGRRGALAQHVFRYKCVSVKRYLTARPNPLLLYTREQQECGRRCAQSINISGYAEAPGLRVYTMSVGLLFSCLISVVVYCARMTEGKARQGRFVS